MFKCCGLVLWVLVSDPRRKLGDAKSEILADNKGGFVVQFEGQGIEVFLDGTLPLHFCPSCGKEVKPEEDEEDEK